MLIVRPCRSTLSLDSEALEGRFSTGYPIETYIQKNSGRKHTGELCSDWSEIAIPA